MQGDYPRFKVTYTHEELIEHFLLSPAERALVDTCRGEMNRHGVAVLLKAVQYLGYFPDELRHVPAVVRTFIAHQLQLLSPHSLQKNSPNLISGGSRGTGWKGIFASAVKLLSSSRMGDILSREDSPP